jgi:UMF1 family MFS transporter
LFGFVQTDTPLFGLSKDAAEHLRATPVLVAIWFAVFSIPLFMLTPDRQSTGVSLSAAAGKGVAALIGTLKRMRSHKEIAKFLLARMIYTDGLNTLFAFGGIFAAGAFGFSFEEVIQFGIAINVTAGLGAAAFAWIDDWIGSKKTILISILGLTCLSAALLLVESKLMFWILGLSLGLFVGPAQAASRSMMAHLAPAEIRTELFGLYAFSGKATAFMGPALLAVFTDVFDSQRAGMATILGFFVVGGLLMLSVKEARA